MTQPAPMMIMPKDSAYRQWKGACRDLRRAEERKAEARNVYTSVLLDEFMVAYAKAQEAGRDVADEAVLAELGMPCVHCLDPYTELSGHRVVYADEAGKNVRWRVWAECGRAAREPQ